MKKYKCRRCHKLLFKYVIRGGGCSSVGYSALLEGVGKYREYSESVPILGVVETICPKCKSINILEAFKIKDNFFKDGDIDVGFALVR